MARGVILRSTQTQVVGLLSGKHSPTFSMRSSYSQFFLQYTELSVGTTTWTDLTNSVKVWRVLPSKVQRLHTNFGVSPRKDIFVLKVDHNLKILFQSMTIFPVCCHVLVRAICYRGPQRTYLGGHGTLVVGGGDPESFPRVLKILIFSLRVSKYNILF